MEVEFLAQKLNSRQLLALLYICESKRKNQSLTLDNPGAWEELLSTFSSRLGNAAEALRFEVLEAHLMSVEDIDIYNNETLQKLIDENQVAFDGFTQKLDTDLRFRSTNA